MVQDPSKFFPRVQIGTLKKYLKIKGENDLILYKFTDSDVYLMPGIIGGPATGGYLD